MNFSIPGSVGMIAIYLYWLAIIVVHICFAVAVFRDAENLEQTQKRKLWFVNGGLWALATLVGGIFTAGIYWVIHHSTLRPLTAPATPAEAETTKS